MRREAETETTPSEYFLNRFRKKEIDSEEWEIKESEMRQSRDKRREEKGKTEVHQSGRDGEIVRGV